MRRTQAAKIVEIVKDRIPAHFGLDPIRDIQVLCPMNRGGLGARALNLDLQRVLNAPGENAIQRFGWTFGAGDKVMQIENDYDKDVYNGDLGFVRAVDPEAGGCWSSSMDARLPTASVSSTSLCSPTRPPFTNRRAPSTRPW